jgi:hypothetical protein
MEELLEETEEGATHNNYTIRWILIGCSLIFVSLVIWISYRKRNHN